MRGKEKITRDNYKTARKKIKIRWPLFSNCSRGI